MQIDMINATVLFCGEEFTHETMKKSEMKQTSIQSNGRVSKSRAVCSVCSRMFREPKLLPCLHTFCADCIRQIEPFSAPKVDGKSTPLGAEGLAGDRNSVTVLCPECDSEVDLPSSGVDSLTTDHLALDEVFMETLLIESSVSCDLCSDGEAGQRCEVCSVNLCKFCSQAHRRQKRTSSHSIHSLEDLKAQGHLSRPVLCSVHAGQELRLFCEPCDLPVCRECAAAFHREHRCRPTHDVINHHGDRIRALVSGSLRPRLGRLEEALRRVDTSQGALQRHAKMLASEIRAFAQGYATAVEAHCSSLLRALEDLRLQRSNQLHLQRAQLLQSLADTGGAVDFAERLLTCGSEAEILDAKGVTVRRLITLLESGYDPQPDTVAHDDGSGICFLPQRCAGQVEGFPMVGVLHAKTTDPSKCVVQGEGVQQGAEGQRGEFTLICKDSAGELMGTGGDAVLVSVVHTEQKDCRVDATVVDNGDGSYAVSYLPEVSGSYSVWVCVKAQHVKGSPFSLTVRPKFRRHHGIFHCCSFCSSKGAKEAQCGCPGTMPGGFQGCGHGHKGHPGKDHWSCCGSLVKKSECLHGREPGSPHGRVRTVEL
ncbi:tripartite motif-containing protein 45 isoform X1 [Electrophorus electricus]|uniref:RING-type E3 ubiquitin transferase n=1 Tax=Electrophorus electricus TaxID=8005 RepID=A0A4W4F5T7_ELEEL|nr:tripartite motif-containing protein 45 isoform X1 [Electrophorus electricus]